MWRDQMAMGCIGPEMSLGHIGEAVGWSRCAPAARQTDAQVSGKAVAELLLDASAPMSSVVLMAAVRRTRSDRAAARLAL